MTMVSKGVKKGLCRDNDESVFRRIVLKQSSALRNKTAVTVGIPEPIGQSSSSSIGHPLQEFGPKFVRFRLLVCCPDDEHDSGTDSHTPEDVLEDDLQGLGFNGLIESGNCQYGTT